MISSEESRRRLREADALWAASRTLAAVPLELPAGLAIPRGGLFGREHAFGVCAREARRLAAEAIRIKSEVLEGVSRWPCP